MSKCNFYLGLYISQKGLDVSLPQFLSETSVFCLKMTLAMTMMLECLVLCIFINRVVHFSGGWWVKLTRFLIGNFCWWVAPDLWSFFLTCFQYMNCQERMRLWSTMLVTGPERFMVILFISFTSLLHKSLCASFTHCEYVHIFFSFNFSKKLVN